MGESRAAKTGWKRRIRGWTKGALRSLTPEWVGVYRVATRERALALTFDDGPQPEYTPAILDTLKRFNARATFFLIGERVEAHHGLVRRIVEEGHDVGVHTYTHCDLSKLCRKHIAEEWERSSRAIYGAAGVEPVFYRPPWGKFTWGTVQETRRRGGSLALWSADSLDYRLTEPSEIAGHIRSLSLVPGDVVLMHDDYPHTVEALPSILGYLAEENWRCATLSELLPRVAGERSLPIPPTKRTHEIIPRL